MTPEWGVCVWCGCVDADLICYLAHTQRSDRNTSQDYWQDKDYKIFWLRFPTANRYDLFLTS